MFRGRYPHTIDSKGRVSIPAKFREALGNDYNGRLVVVPNEHCLEVHPLEEWQRIEAKVRELPSFNPEVKKISRLYISKAKDVDLDTQGRILLPPDSRGEAGLTKDVAMVGGGLTHFEIWDRRRWEEFDRLHQDELPTIREKLSSLGV
jgi:MraZ protein